MKVLISALGSLAVIQTLGDDYTFTTFAGQAGAAGASDGTGSAARFNFPASLGVDAAGNVYVADQSNFTIRKISPGGAASTLAGLSGSSGTSDGTGSAARFLWPQGVTLDPAGRVVVGDTGNDTIRKLTLNGTNWSVTTLAGQPAVRGAANGVGNGARFNQPAGVAADSAGNLYVADWGNHSIRKVTPGGVVTTLAGMLGVSGSTDGTGSTARFRNPENVAVDGAGNVIVADSGNHTIRKIARSGQVTTLAGLAGNPGSIDGVNGAARFNVPISVAVDPEGNILVADYYNYTIRKLTASGTNWIVSTLAGLAGSSGSANGTGSAARFNHPWGIAADRFGKVYVADHNSHTIRKGWPTNVVYSADFESAVGPEWSTNKVGTTPADNRKYLGNFGNEAVTLTLTNLPPHAVVRVSFDLFILNSWDGGNATFGPDVWSLRVRDGATLLQSTFANNRDNASLRQSYPARHPGALYPGFTGAAEMGSLGYPPNAGYGSSIMDSVYRLVFEFVHADATLQLDFTGSGLQSLADESWGLDNVQVLARGAPTPPAILTPPEDCSIAATYPLTFLPATTGTSLSFQWQKDGGLIPGATNAALFIPSATTNDIGSYRVTVSNVWGVLSSSPAALAVRAPLVVTTLAGQAGAAGTNDGVAASARFNFPRGMAVDSAGNLYVADYVNHTIRKVTSLGVASTFAGQAGQTGSIDGSGTSARFNFPVDVALDTAGNLYVADQANHTIRKITSSGAVTTLAGSPGMAGSANGTGASARFNGPLGIAVDRADNIYVTDANNRTIRKLTLAGAVTTLAGLAGSSGSADGSGSQARFDVPRGIATDSAGNIYVAEFPNNTIRKITPAGVVTTVAGLAGTSGSADGLASAARFNGLAGVAVDGADNIYAADPSNQTIRHITPEGLVTTVAGLTGSAGSVNGAGSSLRLSDPRRITADSVGNVYVVGDNHTIRKGWPALGATPPAIDFQPQNQTVVAGANVTLTVVVSGLPSPQYQWFFNGIVIGGANASSLSLQNVDAARTGGYRVQVSNALGAVMSDVAP